MKLTVLLVSYNHEEYIAKAVESIKAQRFNGSIEVLVADDGSTDRTREIISTLLADSPTFALRFLDHNVRLGATKNYKRAFAACAGEFVAILEGDDYWINPLKLAKQVRFLERHHECPACASNYFIFRAEDSSYTPRNRIEPGFQYVDAPLLIADNIIGNFSTCVYRTSLLKKIPDSIFEVNAYDWLININISKDGPIGLLHTPLSVYRIHSGGLWSGMPRVAQLEALLKNLAAYDTATAGRFKLQFEQQARHIRHQLDVMDRTWTLKRANRIFIALLPRILPLIVIKLVYWFVPPAAGISLQKARSKVNRYFGGRV